MIYDFKRRVESSEEKIRQLECPDEWKSTIFRFENYLFADGLKHVRIAKYLINLRLLITRHNIDLLNPSKDEIIRVIGEIEKSGLKDGTKREYKVTIKRFYRWMNDGKDPEYTEWFHVSQKKTDPRRTTYGR